MEKRAAPFVPLEAIAVVKRKDTSLQTSSHIGGVGWFVPWKRPREGRCDAGSGFSRKRAALRCQSSFRPRPFPASRCRFGGEETCYIA